MRPPDPARSVVNARAEFYRVRGARLDPVQSDTDPKIEALMVAGYRRMSVAEKLEIVRSASLGIQELALMDIRRRHPNADEREQLLRLASRRLDKETMRRVFGWDVDVQGY